jgi:hypothetical protein
VRVNVRHLVWFLPAGAEHSTARGLEIAQCSRPCRSRPLKPVDRAELSQVRTGPDAGLNRTRANNVAIHVHITGGSTNGPCSVGKKVNNELNKLAPDKKAMRGWVESQNFTVINSQHKIEGSWWFEAENPKMSYANRHVERGAR